VPERKINSIADAVRIIDELVTNEMEWSDYTNEDLQKAWNIIKNRVQ
tara:strand:+ start:381 stop:521 length:141 start_codon:yes stop_codon:yes gene_type:complete